MHLALASKKLICRMSDFQRSNAHTVSRLTVRTVWSTKYRYKFLKGVVSKDHVHMHIEYRPS